MKELLYFNEQKTDIKNDTEFKGVFKCGRINEGDSALHTGALYNHLLFLREGCLKISCDEFADRELRKDECILIAKGSNISYEVLQAGILIVFIFDILQNPFENYILQSCKTLKSKTLYTFIPVSIHEPLIFYLDLFFYYKGKGIEHEILHEIKEKELFLLLYSCYAPEEIVKLLHPIIGGSNFKNFVYNNYLKVKNVTELVDLSGMGRTAFDYTFRNVFGTSARQWMLLQMAKQVKYKAMDPEITIKDLIIEFKFNSASHFNHFCRKQFDCTPKELIKNSAKHQII
ncbi:MAG: AraC family transcriptional regulator [Tannerellaceae bacterium]|jgi:AraC-like DNA-binding protein|nr:AraC family transcriptional regulator [Tannerellaceae bacterium]